MENDLPIEINEILNTYLDGLRKILGSQLYGVYLTGAAVFPEAGPIQDLDCHVILRQPLTDDELNSIRALHAELARSFPGVGDLDSYYILLEAAQGFEPPQHQINPQIVDNAWALHCAHIRRGFYRCLYGPEPVDLFPTPSWQAITGALENELIYIRNHLHYHAYCILNLCRIMYTYTQSDPVVSKRFSGKWASEQFPEWEPLIQAALRFYEKEHNSGDEALMNEKVQEFLQFATNYIQPYAQ